MSKKLFLVDLDLNGNALRNAAVESLSTAPTSPVAGQTYFDTTDSKFKYYNGTDWVAGAEFSAENLVADVASSIYGIYDSTSGDTFKFRVLKTNDERIVMSLTDGVIGFALNMIYKSSMPDDLIVPTAVGGIAAGTTAADLKAKTVDAVLDDLLFPEVNPTITNPSASISFGTGFTASQILEVGATAPTASNINTSFNRGTVTCPGQDDMYRAGELDTDNSYIYYGGSTSTTTLPTAVVLGSMQYQYHAAYGEGDTLLTSKGNVATANVSGTAITNPLAAGSVNSSSIYQYGTYPFWSSGIDASTTAQASSYPSTMSDTKLTLIKWTDTLIASVFASEASTGERLTFSFPTEKTVSKVEFMNTVSGNWETFSGWEILEETSSRTVQGATHTYKTLTTTGSLSGAIQLRFTIANA